MLWLSNVRFKAQHVTAKGLRVLCPLFVGCAAERGTRMRQLLIAATSRESGDGIVYPAPLCGSNEVINTRYTPTKSP